MPTLHELYDWIAEAGPAQPASSLAAPVNVQRVTSLVDATANAAVFASDAATLQQAIATEAALIFAPIGSSADDDRVLPVRDPRLAFTLLAHRLRRTPALGTHLTASIDPGAELAADVEIGPGAVVAAGVRIGAGSRIGARVVLERGITLGERVTVQSGAVLGSYGFGYARRPSGSYLLFPQQGTLVIEDDVEIGANSTIDRGALGETRIGAGTKIDNLVHIGHNCRIGRNVILAAQTGISGSTVVEDGAILGGQVGIGEHATVGPGVILGGGAGVLSGKKLFGAGQVFWGRPAQPLRQYLRDLARLRKGA
ncbi:UDP-3-O-(3-hydroxymyristoyl)glucosamine N-acyltransferase [Terriglobus aquaticus]|uniref:UDP-3-O-(3-hydroxymyristoyl)glucosamine N-acyltransferase n=1 Tax=Terriglobus aquaticus TaxID=940139 RepID=A0ABW9KMV8_9BACT|nr:UDP-3-O-(3-hydroxymyristoyl)glucosamine N-acyltransferase [Terriglobus aquaticus]